MMPAKRAPRAVQTLTAIALASLLFALVIAIQALALWMAIILVIVLGAIVIGGQLWKL
jgi:hypothetical protein